VARAKRTDRAAARRRYRAQVAEQAAAEAETTGSSETTTKSAPRQPAQGQSAAAPAAGVGYAFRAAFRPANVRDDFAHLPELVRHPAVWGPIAASIAIAAVTVVTGGRDIISAALVPFFVWPPPQIGALFIAGFFAPRASYLAGGLVGIAISFAVAGVLAVAPTSSVTTPAGVAPSPSASVAPTVPASPGSSASAGPNDSAASSSAAATTSSNLSAAPSSSAAASAAPGASASPGATPAASASPSPGTTTPTQRLTAGEALLIGLGISPAAGVLLGSFSAWYRRFLRLASPNRGRQPARRQQSRRR
jgi:hypothetical protein